MTDVPEASRELVDQVIPEWFLPGSCNGLVAVYSVARRSTANLAPYRRTARAAIERSIGLPVVPTGALALNALHLSEQVPAKLEFKTAGPSKIIKVGKRQIRLRHAPARHFRARARIVPLVIEALSALGRGRVTADTIRTIRSVVNETDSQHVAQTHRRHPSVDAAAP